MTKTTLRTFAGAASALFLLGAQTVAAGTDKVRAEAYFNAISGGNAETIASFYADNAEFHWVGGPLAGVYTGKAQIKGVWERFSKAAGDINYKVLELSESQKGKRSTVTARVNFIGPKEVPVRFIMVYENGKIVNEVWEVDKPVTGYANADPKSVVKPQATVAAEPVQPETAASQADQDQASTPDESIETAAAAPQESGVQDAPVQVNAVSVGEDTNAKAPRTAGVPVPLPPVAKTTPPKKTEAKPAPKKRYAEKKNTPEYGQRDEEGEEGYEGSDPDDVYYGRPRRFYGGYGRHGNGGWYGGGYGGGYGGYGRY